MKKKYIWVLLEAGETKEAIATLDEKTIGRLAETFWDNRQEINATVSGEAVWLEGAERVEKRLL